MIYIYSIPLLSITIFLPFITTICIFISKHKIYFNVIAILGSCLTFILSICLYLLFNSTSVYKYQFIEKCSWFYTLRLEYYIGIDNTSLLFILLTTTITLICIILAINSIKHYFKECLICILLIEGLAIGVFSSLNLMLFFIFFESIILPIYLIIKIWGKDNSNAAVKFFLYTLTSSLLFLISIIYIYIHIGHLNFININLDLVSKNTQNIIWWLLFISFSIKSALFPFHSWLGSAHTDAPTFGSILLAGIILKIGVYGFFRILLNMFPTTSNKYINLIITLSIINILYGSLLSINQNNIKKIIAYSSVSNIGYIIIGIFSFSEIGIKGSIFQTLSHSLVSSGLFLIIGLLSSQTNTMDINHYGGLSAKIPKISSIFLFLSLANIGIPGTTSFIGELFTLIGLANVNIYFTFMASLGLVLTTIYMLCLYNKIMLGNSFNKTIIQIQDNNSIELFILIFLTSIILCIGIYPNILTFKLIK